MHVFTKSGYRLGKTSLETRISYSAFLLLMLPGLATMLALSIGRIGISPQAIAAFYRGGQGEMSFPKELWQLMEEAHFHLFSVPVILLVLTHLLFATGCPPRTRVTISLGLWTGAVLEIGAPFAVRYWSAAFAPFLILGWALLSAGMLASVGYSLAALWGGAPPEAPPEPQAPRSTPSP
jgi:hypothetical protein